MKYFKLNFSAFFTTLLCAVILDVAQAQFPYNIKQVKNAWQHNSIVMPHSYLAFRYIPIRSSKDNEDSDIADQPDEFESLMSTASAYEEQENYEEAINYYKQALEVNNAVKNPDNFARTSVSLSKIYIRLFRYDAALKVLLPLISPDEEIKVNAQNKEIIFSTLGDIYSKTEEVNKALEFYLKAYEISDSAGLVERSIDNLCEAGVMHSRLRQRDESISISMKALSISESKNIDTFIARILRGLGYTYYFKGEVDSAVLYFSKHLDWAEEQKDEYVIAQASLSLAQAYLAGNKTEEAEIMFEKSTSLFEKQEKMITDLEKLTQIYLSLYVIDMMHQNYGRRPLENYKKYIVLRDSTSAKDQLDKIAAMEIAYRAEKKDEEIKLLMAENEVQKAENELQKLKAIQERNLRIGFVSGSVLLLLLLAILYNRYRAKKETLQIIQHQNQAIQDKNNENELLIKEIHHRVKNNLQIILSLLNAQVNSTEGNMQARNILLESQNKIKSMALIHQNLYTTEGYMKVPTTSYFKDLINHIKSSYSNNDKNITFESNIENNDIKITLALPLGLIVNELITNSYKYAFDSPDLKNRITINFNKTESKDRYKLEVFDNGIGLPKNFNMDNTETFGLQMIKGLTNQVNGKMEYRNGSGAGFNIYVEDIEPAERNGV